MNPLHRIRQLAAGLWGRAMLLWVLLSLGVASAAPLVHAQGMEIVCSAAGEVTVVFKSTADGAHAPAPASHWDCAMCLPFTAPPAHPVIAPSAPPSPLVHALRPVETARIAGITAAPLPARGPPGRA